MSRKENALDLAKFIDKGVRVKLSGGREGVRQESTNRDASLLHMMAAPKSLQPCAVEGTLKGYDQLLNLVLDETTEFLRGAAPPLLGCGCLLLLLLFVQWSVVTPAGWLHSDKDDPLRITDETRSLGLVVHPVYGLLKTLLFDTSVPALPGYSILAL